MLLYDNIGPHTVSKKFRESEAVLQDQSSDGGGELKWFRTTKEYEPYAPKENLSPMFMDPQDVNKLSQIQTDLTRYVKESIINLDELLRIADKRMYQQKLELE